MTCWPLARRRDRLAGGESGIRTHGTLAGTRDFQSRLFVLSSISPRTRRLGGLVPDSNRVVVCVRRTVGADGWRGGESGIRTHDKVAPIPVFETGAFSLSAISPLENYSTFAFRQPRWGRLYTRVKVI